ncbi:telomere-associated protein RIF1-like isoform X2 [Nematostella vectensis]|uniref:telomere-associated protein RIF1-like isoform X2 n=1 Tax=Nematostella vectensis TaxID=45351 RepID=UPI0020775129|nr:telomere-associated protein RIF1-like isoform X2 [Nematostella vectensis]
MVTLPELEGMFVPLLRSIQDKKAPSSDHVDAYLRLTERLREENEDFLDEVCSHVYELSPVFKRHCTSNSVDVSQAALQAMGHCLYHARIARSFSEEESLELLQVLVDVIKSSDDKGACTRALWCIAKQNLPVSVVIQKLSQLMTCLDSIQEKEHKSATVDYEAVCFVERMLFQVPAKAVTGHINTWSKFLLDMTISSAAKVREHALSVVVTNLEILQSHQQLIIPWLSPALKSEIIGKLSTLFAEGHELFVLRLWRCIVVIHGKMLHRGGLLNDMLKLVEQGFKNHSADVQVCSYSAWRALIDCFALSQDVLSSQKRIKLIMMPFLNSVVRERSEQVEAARLDTWWHFVCSFHQEKIVDLFDQICVPLLQFIFGTAISHTSLLKSKVEMGELQCPPTPTDAKLMSMSSLTTPKSNARRSLKDVGTPKTPTVIHASFRQDAKKKLLLKGCYILAEFLHSDNSNTIKDARQSLAEHLPGVIFRTPEIFEKSGVVIINATREAFKSCGYELDGIACHMWKSLVLCTENLIKKGVDHAALFHPLLATFEELVEGNFLPSNTCLAMLDILSKVSPRILSHGCNSLQSRTNLHGSAAILLIQLLFSDGVLKDALCNEKLHLVFEKFAKCGLDGATNQLGHTQSVMMLLDTVAVHVTKKETLWRLWVSVASPVNELISKTNDVNQGNALEHNFTAVEMTIVYPFKHLIDSFLNQGLTKLTVKTVSDIYRNLSCSAALVASADANTSAEEVCSRLLGCLEEKKNKDVAFIDSAVNILTTILECLDFSSPSLFDLATTASGKSPNRTPTKFVNKPERPLGNLTSLVQVLNKLLLASASLINSKEASKHFGIFCSLMTNLTEDVSLLFGHVTGRNAISECLSVLSPSLALIMEGAHQSSSKKRSENEKKLYNLKFIQKQEKLWTNILTCIQSRFDGPFNSELLAIFSPLLEIAFCHLRRQIKNQAVMFWNATFSLADSLEYPSTLRPVLNTIKEKMSLKLPGWDVEKAEDISQPPPEFVKPHAIPGSPVRRKPLTFSVGSPKMKGSFLHKAVEAEKALDHVSPKKALSEPRHGEKGRGGLGNTHARRKLPLSIFDDDSQDYVAIAPSPNKKRFLTEHQKEVLHSRSDVPALYNALDQSQDGSVFFATQESSVTSYSQSEVPEAFEEETEFEGVENKNGNTKEDMPKISIPDVLQEDCSLGQQMDVNHNSKVNTEQSDGSSVDNITEKQSVNQQRENIDVTGSPERSPDVIPSSQVSTNTSLQSSFLRKQSLSTAVNALNKLENENSRERNIPQKPVTIRTTTESQSKKNEKPTDCSGQRATDDVAGGQEVGQVDKSADGQPDRLLGGPTDGQADGQEDELPNGPAEGQADEGKAKDVQTGVSPIAGRTRRGKKLKSTTPKRETSSKKGRDKKNESAPSKTIFDMLSNALSNSENIPSKNSHETGPAPSSEKLEPAQTTTDAVSSPISSAKIKFIKPYTGSPKRPLVRTLNSPVASPSGILKRVSALEKTADSPSPPKTRRVSFAVPLNQDEQQPPEDKSGENESETAACPEVAKTTPTRSGSQNFTLLKRRRSAPAPITRPEPSIDDTSGSIYPDLVSCKLPVEQILPSLCSSNWSRGLGHVVHAQNIRTIGNLSALKEHQIKNLPIRSPKVETLRSALSTFHKRTKGPRTRLALNDAIEITVQLKAVKEGEESQPTQEEQPPITEKAAVDSTTLSQDTTHGNERHEINLDGTRNMCKDEATGEERREDVNPARAAALNTKLDNATVVADSESFLEEKSYTPPLHVESQTNQPDDALRGTTPKRCASSKPVTLFTPEIEENGNAVLNRSEKTNGLPNWSEKTDAPPNGPEKTSTLPNGPKKNDSLSNGPEKSDVLLNAVPDGLENDNALLDGLEKITQPMSKDVSSMDCVDSKPLGNEIKANSFNADVGNSLEDTITNDGIKATNNETEMLSKASLKSEKGVEAEPQCEGKIFCTNLNSALGLASPEVLARLSSEEIFTAHQNLSELMSRVIDALKARWQSPVAKK